MATPNRKRLYQAWKGHNKFFCRGRMIFGPDASSILLTLVLIVGPSAAFCCQAIANITNSKVEEKSSILGIPVLVVALVVALVNLVSLYLTSARDPGIVPRNSKPPDSETFDMTTPSMEWVTRGTPHLKLPRTKDVVVNGYIVKVKFCDTCLLYRPPRASHCSICNNCIQRFDHHCPWVGQCIGICNYRFFFLFISSSTFLCIYVFVISWINIIGQRNHYGSILKSIRGEIISIVLIVYTFVAIWFVGGLTVFHSYLSSTNQTTYENFRYRYDKKENPYNRGVWRNFKELFFSRIPPSLNNFRSWVIEEPPEVLPHPQNVDIDVDKKKVKVDNDLDPTLGPGGNTSIPRILQNLSYSSSEGAGSKDFDHVINQYNFEVVQEVPDQEEEQCSVDASPPRMRQRSDSHNIEIPSEEGGKDFENVINQYTFKVIQEVPDQEEGQCREDTSPPSMTQRNDSLNIEIPSEESEVFDNIINQYTFNVSQEVPDQKEEKFAVDTNPPCIIQRKDPRDIEMPSHPGDHV